MGGKANLKTALVMAVLLVGMAPAIAAGGTIYVDADASTGGDGTTWGTAYKYLQDALYKPPSGGDEIWVAAGTYRPDDDDAHHPGGTGNRYATFQLKNGVAIYGGFAGYGEPDPYQRNIQLYETILSGDLNGDDVGFTNNGENSYHVVTGSGTDATAILDGFTITAGNADGSYPDYDGGGMYNDQGSPTISNCTFSGNSAVSDGGGMNNITNSYPSVSNCTFSGNSAYWGGGMDNGGGSSPTVTNCSFSDNSAGDIGGGMFNSDNSNPTVTNCTFSGNSCNWDGGGMHNYNASPTVTNCAFTSNDARYGGGGMYNYDNSSPTVTNCTFSGNQSAASAGMGNGENSNPTVVNCTFTGNLAGADGGGMENWGNSNSTVTNCTFSGNSADGSGGGMCNDESNPTVTNCTFAENSAGSSGGGMRNTNNSSPPAVTNCILWGNTAPNGAQIYNAVSSVSVSYSDVQGGWSGTGNIDEDPLFVDANNPDPSLRDYHLWPGSPCIDTGNNNSLPADTTDLDGDGNTTEAIPWDIDSDARVSDGTVDMGSDEVIWDSNDDVDQGKSVILNPGGGSTDPNTEALVVFENVSGPNDANITVVEMSSTAHPEVQDFQALGKTLRIDTSLADGQFFMTVSIPFDANDLAGEDPFSVDLMYWEDPPGKWRHAVKANTDPQQSNPKKNRWQEEYPPTSAPTLAELKARGMGANGVFWNSDTQQGFVWANVDHTTDFEGLAHNIADFEPDGDVDLRDLWFFVANWLDTCTPGQPGCGGADLTYDGNVDFVDFAIFANHWLLGE